MAERTPFTLKDLDEATLAKASAAAEAAGLGLEEWIARTIASQAEVGGARPAGPSDPQELRAGLAAVAAKAAADPDAAREGSQAMPAASPEELAALKLALSRIAASETPSYEPHAGEGEAAEAAEAELPRVAEASGADDTHPAPAPSAEAEPGGAAQEGTSSGAGAAHARTSEIARRLRLSAGQPAEREVRRSLSPEHVRMAGIALGALIMLGLVAWLAFGSRPTGEVKSEAAPSPAPAAAPSAASAPAATPTEAQAPAGNLAAAPATPAAPVAAAAPAAPAVPAAQATAVAPAAASVAPVAATPAAPAATASVPTEPIPTVPPPAAAAAPSVAPQASRMAEAKPPAQAKAAAPAAHGPYTVAEIEALAKEGDPRAAYDLATLYARGDEIPRDFFQAARWFRKAADQGIAGAQYNLGVLYQQGVGVEQNMGEAVRLYLLLPSRAIRPPNTTPVRPTPRARALPRTTPRRASGSPRRRVRASQSPRSISACSMRTDAAAPRTLPKPSPGTRSRCGAVPPPGRNTSPP